MKVEAIKRVRQVAVGGLAAIAIFCALSAFRTTRPILSVVFLDVGQGKCAVVIAPNGNTLMVDAGTQTYGREGVGERLATQRILPALARLGIRRLHVMVVTHPDKDHCNAVPIVARELRPVLFLSPAGNSSEPEWLSVKAAFQGGAVTMVIAQRGQRLWLDPRNGIVAEVLGPPSGAVARVSEWTPNEASTVLKLRWQEFSVLFTGDLGETGQRWLLQSGTDLRATVLDVPHHGSKHNTATFLRMVRPKIAVISAGRQNPFGHPAPETVKVLQQMGATIWLTGEQGSLLVRTDGRQWTLTGLTH